MKKLTTIILALTLLCGLTACGGKKQTGGEPTPPAPTLPAAPEQSSTPETPEVTVPTPEPVQEPEAEAHKVLVAYFSATGNTRPLAEAISEALDADLFEIQPETPYTTEDLNWHDTSTRATVEQNDPNARPAISGSVENMEDYDVIFLGYPIWWGTAPKIIHTFLESYDFNGKTIIPFCTSGSSGYSDSTIKSLVTGATWVTGRRFSGGASQSTAEGWIDSLNLNISAN